MKAVRWATIAMLAAIGLTILGIKLGLLWRGALVPQMLVLVGGFSLIFSRAAYIITALATWLPKRFRLTRKRRE